MADTSNDSGSTTSGGTFNGTYTKVANTLFVGLASGWCLLVGALPLVLAVFLLQDLAVWPMYFLALALSAPGIAAVFAVFRDQPTLFSGNAALRARILADNAGDPDFPPDWIAGPYVRSDRDASVIRPYFRAYARLFPRALAMGVTFGVLLFAFVYNMLMFSRMQAGVAIAIVSAVCSVFLLQAMLIALVLIVEYPKAKYLTVLKNAVLLSVRRWYMMIVSAVVLGVYVLGLTKSAVLVMLLFTGVLAYMLWASARWQADRLFVLMARESGDRRIIDMYGPDPQSHGGRLSSFLSGTSDWRQ